MIVARSAEKVFQDYRRGTTLQLLDQYRVDAILITGYEYYTGSEAKYLEAHRSL